MGAIGTTTGSAIAMMLGLPPQAGAFAGNYIEDDVIGKKKKKNDDGTDAAVSGVFENLLGPKMGGQGGGDMDPFMAAINGMSMGGESDPGIQTLNQNKEIYQPPQLMGFPSLGKAGYNASIKAALAAKRGF